MMLCARMRRWNKCNIIVGSRTGEKKALVDMSNSTVECVIVCNEYETKKFIIYTQLLRVYAAL